jgi:hypothetical protein
MRLRRGRRPLRLPERQVARLQRLHRMDHPPPQRRRLVQTARPPARPRLLSERLLSERSLSACAASPFLVSVRRLQSVPLNRHRFRQAPLPQAYSPAPATAPPTSGGKEVPTAPIPSPLPQHTPSFPALFSPPHVTP